MPWKTTDSTSVLANWTQRNKDLSHLHQRILHEKDSHTVEELWNDFKETLSKFPNENIQEKLLKHANLPWITNDLRKKILIKKQTKNEND